MVVGRTLRSFVYLISPVQKAPERRRRPRRKRAIQASKWPG